MKKLFCLITLSIFPKKFDLNTNTNGEHRAFVLTGTYEEVFPLDIFPMQILKACMYQDLDEMEALGMYEVAQKILHWPNLYVFPNNHIKK